MTNIKFEKASLQHIDTIMNWLNEPHMMEFWDNSQEHKDDILNFIYRRKQHYFYGTTEYFIGSSDNESYCFVLADILQEYQNLSSIHRENLSKKGHTISLDFGIGNKDFLGKGLAAPTLTAFMKFYQDKIDKFADTFYIDPDEKNPRAMHVYAKAGFKQVGEFIMEKGVFEGHKTILMVKRL